MVKKQLPSPEPKITRGRMYAKAPEGEDFDDFAERMREKYGATDPDPDRRRVFLAEMEV